MELKEFVKSTLLDILEGVREAQEANQTGSDIVYDYNGFGDKTKINFDVALTATNEKSDGRGVGVVVASLFGFGADEKQKELQSTISRVQFSVDVRLISGFQVRQEK